LRKLLASHGIHVFITPELRPAPYLCFAVKEMNASFAVMVTASHNSKEYNGYKIYESDGSEIRAPGRKRNAGDIY
jgi:phosphomannomutase